jgi:hypothetical protein
MDRSLQHPSMVFIHISIFICPICSMHPVCSVSSTASPTTVGFFFHFFFLICIDLK